jgi:hypothetical protein
MFRVTHNNQTSASCPLCHSPLEPLNRETAAPLRASVPLGDLLRRPFRVEPILTALAISLPVWLSWLPGFGRFLAALGFAAAVAYYFQVIDHVGRGEDGMPESTQIIENPGDIIKFSIRGGLCVLVGLLPFLAWWYLLRDGGEAATAGLGWLVAGQVYMPAALLTVVITGSTAGALWPLAWVEIVRRAPIQYLSLAGVYLVSIVVLFFAGDVFKAALGFIPVAGGLLALTLERLLWFTQAALVGGFLARNADKLGWD